MSAKEYLLKIKYLDICIKQRQEELADCKRKRSMISGTDYSKERVQTSNDGIGFMKESDRIVDLEKEIEAAIINFNTERNKIINQIQQVDKATYCEVLYRRYVKYECFEEISYRMHLSYNRVIHLHGEALSLFQKMFLIDIS